MLLFFIQEKTRQYNKGLREETRKPQRKPHEVTTPVPASPGEGSRQGIVVANKYQ